VEGIEERFGVVKVFVAEVRVEHQVRGSRGGRSPVLRSTT
jgi:hypothetical protein